jgi:hypothetical protein
MNYHPAAMYYCPQNDNPHVCSTNPDAVDYAYGLNPHSGGNKKVLNMGKNHACSPYDAKTKSEIAWDDRYNKLSIQNGGGYYLAVAKPPIGGRSAIGTYANCCPPLFCGNLTGGSKKKVNKYHRIGYSIFETDKLLSHLKKNDLNKIINKFTNSGKHIKDYHKYFDKNILRTLASTLLLDTYINKNNKLNSKLNSKYYVQSLNNVIKKDTQFNYVMSYLNDVVIKKRNIRDLHQKGGYSNILYPLGYYISPVGANMFTATAILFFMNMLYKLKNNKKLVGGMRLNKKDIVDKIKNIIQSIHKFKFTKKNIQKLSDVSLSMKDCKKKAKKHYRSKGGFAPIDYMDDQPLSYNYIESKQLETNKISQQNINNYLRNNLVGAIGGGR